MDAIWSRRAPVSCLHPGWNPISEREELLASWRGILDSPSRPRIECFEPQVRVYGDAAVVLCYEKLESGYLLATNIFVREEGGWKMTHHHAGGPVPPPSG